MRRLLSVSTALAAVLAFAPVQIDFAEAKEKSEKASKSENSRSDRANKNSGGEDDAKKGHGNSVGDDLDNRTDGEDPTDGNSGFGNDDRDRDGGDDDDDDGEETGDQPRSVNIIPTLNSPKKLNAALDQLGGANVTEIELAVQPLGEDEPDLLLRGGSTQSIQNALDRLGPPGFRQKIEALLETEGAELGDIVGLEVERGAGGNVTKIIILVN